MRKGLQIAFHVIGDLFESAELGEVVVGYGDAEAVFERHRHVDALHGARAVVLQNVRVVFEFVFLDAELFRQQLDETEDRNQLYEVRRVLENAKALSNQIRSFGDDELKEEYILPFAFDKRIGQTVAQAVIDAARRSGSARL